MKTNHADLETQLEARCSTSQPRIWYSKANTNLLPANDASFETSVAGWTKPGTQAATTITRVTSEQKYGDACMEVVFAGGEYIVYCVFADFASYAGKTMAFSVRLLGAAATGATVWLHDQKGTSEIAEVTLSTTEWLALRVSRTITDAPDPPTKIWVGVRNKDAGAATVYCDGAKLEEAAVASNWSSRFFDVDDIKADGVTINATEFSSLLRGRLEWGQKPDESAPAPLMAYTQEMRLEIRDDGSTVANWMKQQTGVHLRIGAATDTAYGDCTPAFHGIIWDWELIEGTEDHYRVVCFGLEKLWQEQKVSADAIDGPRHFGIVKDTLTTVDSTYVYETPSGADYHLWKAKYDNQEVNRLNAVVCAWPVSTVTDATKMLHCLWPIESGKEIVADYFQGRSYSDVIEYFESATGITGNMPESRMGHGGDTLTATLGPWAHLDAGASAWRSLADAAGRKYYGYRYDEHGQIVLKELAGSRSATAATRTTATPGNVRTVQRLDDVYRINDATIEYTKYGVDSATGATQPVQNGQTYFDAFFVLPGTGEQRVLLTGPSSPNPFVPQSNAGAMARELFGDAIAISDQTTMTDDWFWGREANSGAVVVAGNDVAGIDCAANADAAGIESIAALKKTYAIFVKLDINAINKTAYVEIGTAQGAVAAAADVPKVRVLFHTDGYIYLMYWTTAGAARYWAGAIVATYYVWDPGSVQHTAYAADTNYWVGIVNDGVNYFLSVCDSDGTPLDETTVASVVVGNVQAGDDYLRIGEFVNDANTCDMTVREIFFCSPAGRPPFVGNDGLTP